MWLDVGSCQVLQWGSSIKVIIELPVATRHRRDMTEKLLKVTLNPNKQRNKISRLQLGRDESYLVANPSDRFSHGMAHMLMIAVCLFSDKTFCRGLRGCAGLPEPSLVAYVISTKISWAGSSVLGQDNFLYCDFIDDFMSFWSWTVHQKNIYCGYSFESPNRGDSNGYPQRMFSWRNNENYCKAILFCS